VARQTFHLIAGPNGAGKTTFYEQYLQSRTAAAFINPDLLVREVLGRWSTTRQDAELRQDLADIQRRRLIAARESLVMDSCAPR